MSTRHFLAQVSLGLGFVITLIHPASSQITPNGAGTIVNPQGNQINITGGTQAGANLFHSFRDFNVNSAQIANFLSNPQIQNILARINGGNPSMINGLLQVTGGNSNLFLMNPAGIVFGQGASLNVTASFTATTANSIGFGNNNWFNAFGNNNYSALTGNPDSFLFNTINTGSIINAGNLAVTPGQGINLIGGNIINTGNLNAGNITLAAVPGTNLVRISQPGHLLSLEIVSPVDNIITPLDLPRLLTGSDLPGIVSNGETVQVAGVNVPTGQGINITSGNLSTSSQSGTINVLGDRVALVNANLNASGSNGGGTIRVGGEYQGGGNNPFNSRMTYVDANSFLNADAINSGNGGRVIIWGDDTTRFYGNISARGGANGGNGGFAEVSGARNLTFAGSADLSAPRGSFGTLLLDPTNIEIRNGTGVGTNDATLPSVMEPADPGAPFVIYERTLELLGAGVAITLQASDNITIQDLADNELTLGRSIAFFADSDGNGVGNFLMNAGDRIAAPGRDILIRAASITGGDIDVSTASSQNGGNIILSATRGNISARSISSGSGVASGNAGAGGGINILAPSGIIDITGNVDSRSVSQGTGDSRDAGNIRIEALSINVGTRSDSSTGAIAAYSRVGTGVSGNGGNIVVRATNGNITATGMTTTAGASISGTAGTGGNIDIDIDAINSNITLFGATINQIDPALVFALDSRSLSVGGGDAGNGGKISINQNPLPRNNGIFSATGEINSSSGVTNPSGNATGNSGNGGAIAINAQSINTNNIDSSSRSDRSNSGDGGSINISSQGNLSTGNISSGSSSLAPGNGGSINISSQSDLSTGNISSFSSGGTTSGDGGDIIISSQGDLSIHTIDSSSPSYSLNAISGNGGDIIISSQGDLSIRTIYSFSSGNTSGNGGDINISSQGDLSISNLVDSGSVSRATSGNGGDIIISSQDNLSTGPIFSQSGNGGSGGDIAIYARNLFLASGSFTARDGSTNATITTQGGLGGGAITITHGGSTTVPFVVGGATVNGTAATITSGTSNTIPNRTTVPVPPADYFYGTNIRISTQAPTPLPTPSISPTSPSSSLPPVLVSLLTNPTPPPTPPAVVVGTPPPVLIPETIPLPSSISIPLTPPPQIVVIAPPVVPTIIIPTPPPLLPPSSPPPTPPTLVIDRPILDANSPGAQSPIPLTAANSNIPIITRISNPYIEGGIRLLDQSFKEEFQAFTGISDEIATLDVNQAQDILSRVTRETNVKPAFIYVFFSPANDVNSTTRTVNSARSELFRNPQNTDTLEVVLVPPTGDLIRVKYPGLRRPEVIEIAGAFTRGVARRNLVYTSASKRIYDLIIAPLEEDLQRLKVDNLVFLMDAGLRSMPLAAMQNKDNKFIIEDYSVGLMPSLTLTDTTYSSLKDSQVLAMGAERFVNNSPLPGVPVELNIINQLRGGNTLLNENFTLNNLRQARRPQQRIVHLATHGSFASGDKSNSFIQLWGNERLTLDQIRQAGWGTPPIDLLVLSACETAQGDRDAELGFAGLAVTSGVRSALASLWLVSDEGTTGLMAEFYQQLQTTTTKSEALRQAQLAMLRGEVRLEAGSLVTPKGNFPLNEELRRLGDKRLTHPFFWSAFTMVGNPW